MTLVNPASWLEHEGFLMVPDHLVRRSVKIMLPLTDRRVKLSTVYCSVTTDDAAL